MVHCVYVDMDVKNDCKLCIFVPSGPPRRRPPPPPPPPQSTTTKSIRPAPPAPSNSTATDSAVPLINGVTSAESMPSGCLDEDKEQAKSNSNHGVSATSKQKLETNGMCICPTYTVLHQVGTLYINMCMLSSVVVHHFGSWLII